MTNILNITNGDSAVTIMREAEIPGDFLPWRDVLHDGPVPGGLSLEALSEVRADFIASQGWGELNQLKRGFIDRDNRLKAFENYDRVILWFEHDLYDQLQILQIFDWFNQYGSNRKNLTMICTEQYLGLCSPEEMSGLCQYENPVNGDQLILASRAWSAFCSKTPGAWQVLMTEDTSALPFLGDAVLRLLEEYPSVDSGLSKTARSALEIIAAGENRPGRVFAKYQDGETRKFMGDSSFWIILNNLLTSSPSLLKCRKGGQITMPLSPDADIEITQAGRDVLSGNRDFLDCIELDRWIGGVHLTSHNSYCWDSGSQRIVRTK